MSFGKIDKLNINNGLYSEYNSGINSHVKFPSFNGKDKFLHAPTDKNPSVTSYQNTIPMQNFYTPRQMLIAYSNPFFVQTLIDANPNIKEFMSKKSLMPAIYPENILNICNSHIMTTTNYAKKIADKMNLNQIDKNQLEQACVFHDYGKILIPANLLEKPSKLTEHERQIVDMHAILGYELLSQTGLNKRVLNLIKNHHNPNADKSDILGQILSVADVYSALRETRSYKEPMSEQDALKLLDQKAQNGEVSTEVVNALKDVLKSAETA